MTTGVSARVRAHTREPALDGIRGIAILLVLAGHAVDAEATYWLAVAGVTLFFILSGYLITGRLQSGQTLRRFYANRARRLLPGMLVMLAVTGAWFLAGGIDWWRIVEAGTYVRDITAGHFGSGWSPWAHMWSLAVEEQFYLLWPLAFTWRGGLRFAPTDRALRGRRLLPRRTPHPQGSPHPKPTTGRRRQRALVVVMLVSFAGMLVAFAVGAEELARFSPLTQAWALALGCVLMLRGWSPAWPAWLTWGWLRWFGVRSYGMYLWHYPMMVVFEGFLPRPLALPLGCALGVGVAVASWRWVESPWLRRPVERVRA